MSYLDLLPPDVSEIIYKKKFHLEILDGLKKFGYFSDIKVNIPKNFNFEIGDMVNVEPDHKTRRGDYSNNPFKGVITRITPKFYYLNDLSHPYIVRYEKKYISKYTPDKIKIVTHSKRHYHYDEGSVWYIPNKVREKYCDYLCDNWVDMITELRVSGTPKVSVDNPYLTLYLEVNRPELGIVWDRKIHPNFRG